MSGSASGRGSLGTNPSVPSGPNSSAAAAAVEKKIKPREFPWILKPYESAPICFMTKFVESDYRKISDAEVWKRLDQKTRKGALYFSELCGQSPDHRYAALLRYVDNLRIYAEVMTEKDGFYLDFAKRILADHQYQRLYREIEEMLPIFRYLSLESRAPGHNLDADRVKRFCTWHRGHSFLRTFIQWQARAGLSHHLMSHVCAAQAHLAKGNMFHSKSHENVTLQEMQDAIKARHRIGNESGESLDFGLDFNE